MRNFDQEAEQQGDRLYNYQFDDSVRRYALRTFAPFLGDGPALELGCHEGGMTRLLLNRYSDVTVVDASSAVLAEARKSLSSAVQFRHGTFETIELPARFQDVFMINVLEHVDDAVLVLGRARSWLREGGRIFVLSPNANAPSRQIAVRMGLITHQQAVTEVEARNGHRRTYALDTFQRDLRMAGLSILHIGGLVFKGLANYQMDKAFAAGIIDDAYLDGCYEVGKVYPDLCASLYAVCGS